MVTKGYQKKKPKTHKRLQRAPEDSPDEPKETPEDQKGHQKNLSGVPQRIQNAAKMEKGIKTKTCLFRKSQKHHTIVNH